LLAQCLGWHWLDSGALYRITALAAQWHGVALDDIESLARTAAELDVQFAQTQHGDGRVILDGRDATKDIRTESCGEAASTVAALAAVREALLERQRAFRQAPGLVADGRDMGTVVFPDASLKIFLTASLEERAARRYKQLKEQGLSANLSRLFRELALRDERDANRPVAPLRAAEDAIILDSTRLGIEEVLQQVLKLASKRLQLRDLSQGF
jgi:cytidylate kinase